MATLYVTDQRATLRKESNRLVIESDGKTLADIHDFKVERVVIFGNAQVTTQAIAFLLDRGIDTTFLTARGKLKGRLAPLESKNIPLRSRQFQLTSNYQFTLSFSRAVVAGKIFNSVEVLARHQRNHPDCNLNGEISQIKALNERIEAVTSIDKMRGVEGQAAALYFHGFAKMLRNRFGFERRTRRPPTDPVNALLSFGYTMIYNETIGALAAVGFDPYAGFYHQAHYGRCSLALDVMEEMRALTADRLALNLVNMEILKAEDFDCNDGPGVTIKAEGKGRFFREYERIMNEEFKHRQTGERTTLRRALHGQALQLQRAIIEDTEYKTFRGRH